MKNNNTDPMIYHFPMENRYILDGYNAQFSSISHEIREVLNSLTQREKNVLEMRFGLRDGYCMSLEETGRSMNRTRDRIRQIEANALKKLRHPSRSKRLEDYVECVGKPIPYWIWTTGMHVYEKLWEADNISFDAANPLTPLPWNDSVQNLEVFEESLRNTKPTAILKQIGYDIRQPEEERQAIIQYAISVCGFSRIYNCLKNLTAIKTNRLASAYRKDLMYVIRNQKRLVSLSPCDENSTTITIDFTNEDDDNHPKGNGKDSLSYSEQNPDIFRNLKPESFLMQLGYNTFVPQEERYSILRYAMRVYGQDMIIRLLRFFISIHKGDKKMQRACQVWLEDLEKCLEQYID